MNTPPSLLDVLRATADFVPQGEPAGNLTLAEGRFEGRAILGAFIENRIASGSIGTGLLLSVVFVTCSAVARDFTVNATASPGAAVDLSAERSSSVWCAGTYFGSHLCSRFVR